MTFEDPPAPQEGRGRVPLSESGEDRPWRITPDSMGTKGFASHMKLLFYNWADCCSQAGGGVTVYLRNLLSTRTISDYDVSMVSSGFAYNLWGRPYWRRLPPQNTVSAKRFEIVNSRLMAPAVMAFGDSRELHSPEDTSVFLDFIRQNGPFDIIHFHNLEGLSLSTMYAIRDVYPHTKLILTLHNYFPFCSQVNLFLQDDLAACQNFHHGENCWLQCKKHASNFSSWQRILRIFPVLQHISIVPGYNSVKNIFLYFRHLFKNINNDLLCKKYINRRNEYRNMINSLDMVLCVSERVRDIAVDFGIIPEITVTEYIGTSMAYAYEELPRTAILPGGDKPIVLTYLGYVRHDKGFYFLLDALSALPPEIAARLTIQIAALGCVGEFATLVRHRLHHFAGVRMQNGYTRDALSTLLADTTLGLVPVIWEDCLPQVALEMHCHGIPLLCSDMGGAKELSQCKDFTFKAADVHSFTEKLEQILTGKVPLSRYWACARQPLTMEEHADRLMNHYRRLMCQAQ